MIMIIIIIKMDKHCSSVFEEGGCRVSGLLCYLAVVLHSLLGCRHLCKAPGYHLDLRTSDSFPIRALIIIVATEGW